MVSNCAGTTPTTASARGAVVAASGSSTKPAGQLEVGAPASATAPSGSSGIYGSMVGAWGNPPANPPTYNCLRVLDASGTVTLATGACSGSWGAFRVPLPPGSYVVERGGRYQSEGGTVRFVPNRETIEIKPGQWLRLAPPPLPGPVP